LRAIAEVAGHIDSGRELSVCAGEDESPQVRRSEAMGKHDTSRFQFVWELKRIDLRRHLDMWVDAI
jgi:hypothetical protein